MTAHRMLIAVLGVAGLFVAGCGSDDSSSDVSTSAAVATTSADVAATPAGCPPVEGAETQTRQFDAPPPDCLTPGATYEAIVTTNKGEFTIVLDPESAPAATNNFVFLARNQYFDDTPCHRIIPNFVVQCGDPTGTGTGGPGYTIVDEPPPPGQYQVGSIAMAKTIDPNSAGSQFFIITGPDGAALPPEYALFGQVTDGLDSTVPAMAAAGTPGEGIPSEPVDILSIRIIES
ncbi:MAG TPA: peptidylprolyl isomerase [Ilumatobacteraceae bacterium]|nr:peptidylprolyl isomerase [Ilumatobacteraceae bacterium]